MARIHRENGEDGGQAGRERVEVGRRRTIEVRCTVAGADHRRVAGRVERGDAGARQPPQRAVEHPSRIDARRIEHALADEAHALDVGVDGIQQVERTPPAVLGRHTAASAQGSQKPSARHCRG